MSAGLESDIGVGRLRFSAAELKDLLVAWIALGVAFALFLDRGTIFAAASHPTPMEVIAVTGTIGRSLATVGIGFLFHELAHKVMAIKFGQIAWFRADYGMLGLAIAAGLAGFLFAAPGAVHHRGKVTARENGLIAIAGPVTNIALAVLFLPMVLLPGFIGSVGSLGVTINLLLAAFNMLPFGPLDGRKVLDWSPAIFIVVFVPSVALAVWIFLF